LVIKKYFIIKNFLNFLNFEDMFNVFFSLAKDGGNGTTIPNGI